jgi:hypothetical protein
MNKNIIAGLSGFQFGLSASYMATHHEFSIYATLIMIVSTLVFVINLKSKYE